MFALNKVLSCILVYILFINLSFIFSQKEHYLNVCNNQSLLETNSNNTDQNFIQLVKMIDNLVYKYFVTIQNCYIASINVIYYLVSDYFIIFNSLFNHSFSVFIDFWTIFLHYNYHLLNTIIILLLQFPNNLFTLVLLAMYLNPNLILLG